MRRIRPPGDAPPWAERLCREIERVLKQPSDVPVGFPEFANAAALPPAADWRNRAIYVADINTIAFSDGTDWYPLDKGAAL